MVQFADSISVAVSILPKMPIRARVDAMLPAGRPDGVTVSADAQVDAARQTGMTADKASATDKMM